MKSLLRYSAPALAVLWFAVPAVQYLGTLQRTALFTQRDVVPGPLIDLDLTPWYVLLLGVTVAHFVLHRLLGGTPAPQRGPAHSTETPSGGQGIT